MRHDKVIALPWRYYFKTGGDSMKALAYVYRPPFTAFLTQILRTGRKTIFENNRLEGMPPAAPGSG